MPSVLVDTSVWVDFFRGARRVPAGFDRLIRTGRVVICGIVEAELLSGVRSPQEREKVETALAGLGYLEMRRTTWERAGEIQANLRRRGQTVPMSDVILAALALEHECRVLTHDRHFERIPGLRFVNGA